MKICDLHTHSNNSFDAQNSVDDMCKTAIDKGLYAIAITDHCEAPGIKIGREYKYGYFDESIPKSIKDATNAKAMYADKIKVLRGLELGEPMHDMECTQRAISYGELDYIIASVHNIRGYEDFYYVDFNENNVKQILKEYFYELAETAEFKHFDTLAHLSYPLRYIKNKLGYIVDLSEYQNEIDEVYKILIKNEKALEINTSGLYKGLGITLPDQAQIKRFKELGGKYVTIGSDSHCKEDVGKGIAEGIAIAKNCGFDSYTIFENHKPVLISIDK